MVGPMAGGYGMWGPTWDEPWEAALHAAWDPSGHCAHYARPVGLLAPGAVMAHCDDDTFSQSLLSHACNKTQLNSYCQRLLQRSLSRTDILYTVVQCGPFQQAIVELAFLDCISFAGELSGTNEEAIQSAAGMALEYFQEISGPLSKTEKSKPNKEERMSCGEVGGESPAEERRDNMWNPSATPKAALNMLCMRVATSRFLGKGEVVYSVGRCCGGWQATVSSSVLPEPWRHMIWTGKVCTSKREAKQTSAQQALACLTMSTDIVSLLHREDGPENPTQHLDEVEPSESGDEDDDSDGAVCLPGEEGWR